MVDAAGRPDVGERVGAPAGSAADAVRRAVGPVATATSDAVDAAGRSAAALGRDAYARGAEAGRHAGRLVRSDPLPSLLAAGVVGFALGFMFGRR